MLFSCTIDFNLIPYFRMTQKSKWCKQARRYLDSQEALAWELKKHWNGESITAMVELSCAVHLNHRRRGDLSNYIKSVEDSLQYAGILVNDYQIAAYGKCRRYHGKVGRVIITLRLL